MREITAQFDLLEVEHRSAHQPGGRRAKRDQDGAQYAYASRDNRRAARRSVSAAGPSGRRATNARGNSVWSACTSTSNKHHTTVNQLERAEVDGYVAGTGARVDGYEIRAAAVARGIPCITTMAGGMAAARAIAAARRGAPEVLSLQEIHALTPEPS